ncbi:hypothetical protein JHK85_006828 [Glycine max]|nr:hypothetical protein JHK85_006828 [Glycine max]KAG5071423.1 hypothetical protein JHK86_006634 [Glycine max]
MCMVNLQCPSSALICVGRDVWRLKGEIEECLVSEAQLVLVSLDEMMLESDVNGNIDRSMFGSVDFDENVDDHEDITLEGEDGEYNEDVDDCGDQEEQYEEYENDDVVEYENMGVETLVGKLSSKRMFAHELVRPKRGPRLEKRKRLSKNVTRCGCEATCHVHVDVQTSRWYVEHICVAVGAVPRSDEW